MVSFRRDVWLKLKSTTHLPAEAPGLLEGKIPLTVANISRYSDHSPKFEQSNRSFHGQNPAILLAYIFTTDQILTSIRGSLFKKRKHWDRLTFRTNFAAIKEILCKSYMTEEEFLGWRLKFFVTVLITNPVLPVPDGQSFPQSRHQPKPSAKNPNPPVEQPGYVWHAFYWPDSPSEITSPIDYIALFRRFCPTATESTLPTFVKQTINTRRSEQPSDTPPQIEFETRYINGDVDFVKRKLRRKIMKRKNI
jgi:hypothetical protein